jgi:N-acetylglucosamine kinase-like BadF-type ATPase
VTSLGIDVGGTASRWAVAGDDGTILARGTAPGATGHLFNPAERARFRATLAAIAEAVRRHAPASAILGVTGLGDRVHDDARAIVAELFGVAPARTGLSDDMELAFRAAFAPGAGHLVSAGTGSIGLHVTAGGEVIRVGGRGLLIDDGGSGTWIALEALNQVYRRIDETGGPADAALLAGELFRDIGGDQWDETRAFVYGSDRGRIGTLAQAVARAATGGDPLAAGILIRAAAEIARLAKALSARAGRLPVAFVGGIVSLHPSIKPAIEAELPGWTITFPAIDAAAYAAGNARQL